jgi:hypothetical protein
MKHWYVCYEFMCIRVSFFPIFWVWQSSIRTFSQIWLKTTYEVEIVGGVFWVLKLFFAIRLFDWPIKKNTLKHKNILVPILAHLYSLSKRTMFWQRILGQSEVLLRIWGTCWEPIKNLMGTHWEPKKSNNPQPQKRKEKLNPWVHAGSTPWLSKMSMSYLCSGIG